MAKTDNFFIRAYVTPDDAGFAQTEIDLGSYVNLGVKGATALRIIGIEGEWVASDGNAPTMDANKAGWAAWQLTTQSQSSMIRLDDTSLIAKGQLWCRNADGSNAQVPADAYSDSHLPQFYHDGYLVATDAMFLGGYGDADWTDGSDLTFSCMIECRLEKVTQANAVSLALSQQ